MRNAILLHGLPSKEEYYNSDLPSASNAHWFPWLQKELLIKEIKADTPEVFRPYEMAWESWVQEVERFPIGRETTLVGHSMGGGFWVRYLSEHPEIQVEKVILIAPWLNLNHEEDTNFFDFQLDPSITDRAQQFIIFASDDDDQDVQNSVNHLIEQLPDASVQSFHGYGHFIQSELKHNGFPELLAACL